MPTLKIPVQRLRENYIRNEVDLRRVYGPAMQARAFRIDQPLLLDRTEEFLTVMQECSDRLPANHPQLWPLMQRIGRGDAEAVGSLFALLLAEGDDRAEMLQAIEVAAPEKAEVYADFGTKSDGHSGDIIAADKVMARELCSKVLLLMGAREEGV